MRKQAVCWGAGLGVLGYIVYCTLGDWRTVVGLLSLAALSLVHDVAYKLAERCDDLQKGCVKPQDG